MQDDLFIIAEAGVNHNGSKALALELIDAAAESGADAVKFQTFSPELLAHQSATRARYQVRNFGDGTQLSMLQSLSLPHADFFELQSHCERRGIIFISSAFDMNSAQFLIRDMKVGAMKVPSGEITNKPLLMELAASGLPVILSTGMATLPEVRAAADILRFGAIPLSPHALEQLPRLSVLQCTTDYPTALEHANLLAMKTLQVELGVPVGFSDHTIGEIAAIAAVAMGGTVFEKHFTLDRNLPGPDHLASMEPADLKRYVTTLHEARLTLGSAEKKPLPIEEATKQIVRKSLFAARPIAAGTIFSMDDFICLRPGTGLSPMVIDQLIGKSATRIYVAGEQIADDELV